MVPTRVVLWSPCCTGVQKNCQCQIKPCGCVLFPRTRTEKLAKTYRWSEASRSHRVPPVHAPAGLLQTQSPALEFRRRGSRQTRASGPCSAHHGGAPVYPGVPQNPGGAPLCPRVMGSCRNCHTLFPVSSLSATRGSLVRWPITTRSCWGTFFISEALVEAGWFLNQVWLVQFQLNCWSWQKNWNPEAQNVLASAVITTMLKAASFPGIVMNISTEKAVGPFSFVLEWFIEQVYTNKLISPYQLPANICAKPATWREGRWPQLPLLWSRWQVRCRSYFLLHGDNLERVRWPSDNLPNHDSFSSV